MKWGNIFLGTIGPQVPPLCATFPHLPVYILIPSFNIQIELVKMLCGRLVEVRLAVKSASLTIKKAICHLKCTTIGHLLCRSDH